MAGPTSMADTQNFSRTPVKRGQQNIPRLAATPEQVAMATADRDTEGNPVPTWKAHAFTYDTSGNLSTDTVTDGTDTWVRTYQWTVAGQSSDSGWVKQDA